MKRILATASVAVLASIGVVGSAQAAPADQACFGQVHKSINVDGALGLDNVGQLVQADSGEARNGGQAKKAAASGLCA